MGRPQCDVCSSQFSLATGRENLWIMQGQRSGGLILELEDAEFTLCYSCLERLPSEPTADDVNTLADHTDT